VASKETTNVFGKTPQSELHHIRTENAANSENKTDDVAEEDDARSTADASVAETDIESIGGGISIGSLDSSDTVAANDAEDMEDMMVVVGTDLVDASADVTSSRRLTTVKEQEEALKKIGNVSRYPLEKSCLVDQFELGRTN